MSCTYTWSYLPHDCLQEQMQACQTKCASQGTKYCGCLVVAELKVACETLICAWGTSLDFVHCCCKKDRLAPEETARRRREFDRDRERLKREWEENTGMTWPKEPDGTDYTAHHLDELSRGGPDAWDNLLPVPRSDHYRINSAMAACYRDC